MSKVTYFAAPGAAATLPFSEAVLVDRTLYLSGQLGTDAELKLVPGGVEAETRQALENIRAVLARHGATLGDVVKCTVMMADMAEWPAMNAVYRTFFSAHLPARSAFGANGLALGARLEIEVLAVLPASSS
jgi:reactive intermediate/imine deaminase